MTVYRAVVVGSLLGVLAFVIVGIALPRKAPNTDFPVTSIQVGFDRAIDIDGHAGFDEVTCSGVLFKTDIVLTAAHCIPPGDDVTINGHKAFPVRVDKKVDLALLYYYSAKDFPVLTVSDIGLAEKIFAVDSPAEYRIYSTGVVAKVTPELLYVTTVSYPGSSGGGIYDKSGHLVGIQDKYLASSNDGGVVFGGIIPGGVVRAFLSAP